MWGIGMFHHRIVSISSNRSSFSSRNKINQNILLATRRCNSSFPTAGAAAAASVDKAYGTLQPSFAERRREKSTVSNDAIEQFAPPYNPDRQQELQWIVDRQPVIPHAMSPTRSVPLRIVRPPYAPTLPTSSSTTAGVVPLSDSDHDTILLHTTPAAVAPMRAAAQLAATVLRYACGLAKFPGITTDQIDEAVHEMICAAGAYPSPLWYAGFPKSVCTSVNEIICHGIPDARPLKYGDVVSFDVSCYLNGVHGDNCATVIVGDYQDEVISGDASGTTPSATTAVEEACNWLGVPYRTRFATTACEAHFVEARRLVHGAREALLCAVETVRPGGCLSDIGAACHAVADRHGYSSVTKYRGHGIGATFHRAPFVKHYRNTDVLELKPGMIFTIEPMLCQYNADCFEWDDDWTVSTTDGGLSAQFEHTVLVTESGVEILTLPYDECYQ